MWTEKNGCLKEKDSREAVLVEGSEKLQKAQIDVG